jgi:hypothetical protein
MEDLDVAAVQRHRRVRPRVQSLLCPDPKKNLFLCRPATVNQFVRGKVN